MSQLDPTPLAPAHYSASVDEFLASSDDCVLGRMAANGQFALDIEQRNAWQQQFPILRSSLAELSGTVFLEFDVPRLGSRIDAVLVTGPAVFPIEFKVGERSFERAHYNQAWDYALDLKNFHKGSHQAPIFPVLLATEASDTDRLWDMPHADGVRHRPLPLITPPDSHRPCDNYPDTGGNRQELRPLVFADGQHVGTPLHVRFDRDIPLVAGQRRFGRSAVAPAPTPSPSPPS